MLDKIKHLLTGARNSWPTSVPVVNTASLMDDWQRDGFVILKGFYKASELREFKEEVLCLLKNRRVMAGDITIDVLEGKAAGKRLKLRDATDENIASVHKLNDLYLELEACRALNLNKRLTDILGRLLGDEPMVINSLSFTKGSQQPHHFDTYYMPPPVQGNMAVSSICLEDQTADAGPLSYYPGSHKIAPYVFSHGGLHAVAEEMPEATRYIKEEIRKRGLARKEFIGEAGDVFLWHGQLYHGGLPIDDRSKTRKTLVTHYWRACDVESHRVARMAGGGCYLKRDHQAAHKAAS